MEFANIQLPLHVVAGLYRHSLVLLAEDMKSSISLPEGDKQTPTIEQNIPIITENKPEVIENTILPLSNFSSNKDVSSNRTTILSNEGKETTPIIAFPINNHPDGVMLKYLGGFSKKISIVVAEHFQPHISDGDLAFLGKLLQACHLSLNDVAIINVVSNSALSNKLWQLMPSEKMIIFDVEPGSIGLPFFSPNFKVQPWNDCLFLTAPSLQDLQEGPAEKLLLLKRKLWDSLKKMFSL